MKGKDLKPSQLISNRTLLISLVLWIGIWVWVLNGVAVYEGGSGYTEGYGTAVMYGGVAMFFVWPVGIALGVTGIIRSVSAIKKNARFSKIESITLFALSVINIGAIAPMFIGF